MFTNKKQKKATLLAISALIVACLFTILSTPAAIQASEKKDINFLL